MWCKDRGCSEQQHTQLELKTNSQLPFPTQCSPDKSLPRSLSPSPVCNTRVHHNGSKWYCSKKIYSSILMVFNHHATGTTLTQFMSISFYANPHIPVEHLTQPGPHLLVSNPMENQWINILSVHRAFLGHCNGRKSHSMSSNIGLITLTSNIQ